MADTSGQPAAAAPNPVVFFDITLGGKFNTCARDHLCCCFLHII